MYGYHYTTIENWKKIKEDGYLLPKDIHGDNENFSEKWFSLPIRGIWLWKGDFTEEAHIMAVFRTVLMHSTFKVVKLRVKVDKDQLLAPNNGDSLDLSTRLTIGNIESMSLSCLINKTPILLTDIDRVEYCDVGEAIINATIFGV